MEECSYVKVWLPTYYSNECPLQAVQVNDVALQTNGYLEFLPEPKNKDGRIDTTSRPNRYFDTALTFCGIDY